MLLSISLSNSSYILWNMHLSGEEELVVILIASFISPKKEGLPFNSYLKIGNVPIF